MVRRSQPASGYVHPRAGRRDSHAFGLEVADESTPNYHRWIADLCRPYVGDRVIEIGAGYGAVTRFLSKGVLDYVATDTAPECLAALESKFGDSANVTVRKLDVLADEVEGEFDSIVMINVLEHLLDDSGMLSSLSRHLTSDGKLVIYVPALNSLYGDWDDMAGHFRRYSKRQLENVVQAAGLVVVESRYVNLMAIPAWFAFSRLGIRRGQSGPDSAFGRDLQIWDRTAVPMTRWIETRLRPPVGLNVLGVAGSPSR
jgi:2-polyprenyl-3-methyl-5-hydroxy-6-metoxy-1,4-benzoquinol methylase